MALNNIAFKWYLVFKSEEAAFAVVKPFDTKIELLNFMDQDKKDIVEIIGIFEGHRFLPAMGLERYG